jgi:hypothetical protein
MKCFVKNWYILKVLEDKTMRPMGRVLFGEVTRDESARFEVYSHVCTSVISSIDADTNRVFTDSGSTYVLHGDYGKEGTVFLSDIPKLRGGIMPEEICSSCADNNSRSILLARDSSQLYG